MIRLAQAACAAWAALAQPAAAGTLTHFDLPGQSAICGAAIADDGTIVGNSIATKPEVNFIYSNGSFTVLQTGFDAGFTAVTGIDLAHRIVGTNTRFTRNFTVEIRGFEWHGDRRRRLAIPGATALGATGINNRGDVVGYYMAGQNSPTLGYLLHGKSVATLDDGSRAVLPAAIDPTGTKIVGTSTPPGGTVTAWLYQNGKFATLHPPGTLATFASGINRAGTITGTYLTGTLAAPVAHGYIYQADTYRTFDVPGATGTQLTGINRRGAITGCYSDNSGTHGLIYTP